MGIDALESIGKERAGLGHQALSAKAGKRTELGGGTRSSLLCEGVPASCRCTKHLNCLGT